LIFSTYETGVHDISAWSTSGAATGHFHLRMFFISFFISDYSRKILRSNLALPGAVPPPGRTRMRQGCKNPINSYFKVVSASLTIVPDDGPVGDESPWVCDT
jgi:hypothetical protein